MISARPAKNSSRLRQTESSEYAPATRSGSRVFQASSAAWTFCRAVSSVKGGSGGRGATVLLLHRSHQLRTIVLGAGQYRDHRPPALTTQLPTLVNGAIGPAAAAPACGARTPAGALLAAAARRGREPPARLRPAGCQPEARASSMVSSAAGSASRRSSGIGSPLRTERP